LVLVSSSNLSKENLTFGKNWSRVFTHKRIQGGPVLNVNNSPIHYVTVPTWRLT